jgi:hypothetical protein
MAKAKKAKKAKKAASKLKRKKLKTSKPAPRKKVAKKRKKKQGSQKAAPKPSSYKLPTTEPCAGSAAGDRVGVVTHYFGHLSVAVVKLDPNTNLHVGDKIHIRGHTTDFGQRSNRCRSATPPWTRSDRTTTSA